MDIAMTKIVTDAVAELLTNNGFKRTDNSFENEAAAYSVKYDEERKLYVLGFTDKQASAEEVELSTWLFDEGTEKDAAVIGEDFCDTISVKLGIKKSVYQQTEVAMPTRNAAGSENTVDSLCQKILAVYPAFKDEYKAHMTVNGSFMSVTFYKATIVKKIRELIVDTSFNKKQIDKLFKIFAEVYYNCDDQTMDTLCGIIIAGAFCESPDKLDDCLEAQKEEYPFFVAAAKSVVEEASKNNKFKAVFGK